jgi:hypothetical protein
LNAQQQIKKRILAHAVEVVKAVVQAFTALLRTEPDL